MKEERRSDTAVQDSVIPISRTYPIVRYNTFEGEGDTEIA